MKNAKRAIVIICTIVFLYILQQFGILMPIIDRIDAFPWWVYLVFAGILFSGFQFVILSKKDKEEDEKWIEEQGQVFIKRMNDERERRNDEKKTGTD
ncbi:sporulation YhaL family protein [Scopulibacillus cellulosilyticus]|uniref:Sporulation YhaL family protein n=1 Tax=Scopulibacillus cellulosilyticus TaxID=2665665 RepID=A0ABW2PSV4_9BACL